jgi:hypothetical protein
LPFEGTTERNLSVAAEIRALDKKPERGRAWRSVWAGRETASASREGRFTIGEGPQQLCSDDGTNDLLASVTRELEQVLLLPGIVRTDGSDGCDKFVPPDRARPRISVGAAPAGADASDRAAAVLEMSSTLKKRRAKMNKHKLRKRRKLERLKSK